MLTQHQEDLYTLYKEIDEICRKYNIEYSIAGGTLIGAIRHKGFIPWDDDMDVYMTLKNWYKFMDVCLNGDALPEGRVLDCQEVNRDFHNPIARYTDITKTAIHKNQVLHNDTAGFVIDVFVLDPIPNDKEALAQYNRDILLFSDLINETLVYSYRFRENKYRYFYYRAKMKLFGKEKVLKEVENMLTQYDEDQCDFYVMRWGGVPLCFPKEMIGHCSVDLPYADTMAMSLDKPYDYLVYHYGDEWMYIPPVTEQQGHDAVFNTEVPYPVMRDEITHILDKKKMNRRYRKRQNISMLSMDSWNDLKDLNLEIRRISTEMEFKADYNDAEKEIREAKANKDYLKITEIFADFIAFQNDRRLVGRFDFVGAYRYYSPVLVNIKEEYFELLLLALFHTGSISVAKRFMDVYEFNKGTKTPFMEELYEDILLFREATSSFSEKKFEITIPLIDKLIEKYPDCNSIIKLKINQYLKIDGIDGNEDKVRELANHGLSLFNEDSDFEKYLLDTQYKNNKKEILIRYISAWENTLNGFIRLDIEKEINDNLDLVFEYCDEHLMDIVEKDEIEISEINSKYKTSKIRPTNYDMEGRQFLSLQILGKLTNIMRDDARIYEKRFQVMHKIAELTTDPEIKALRQYELIGKILKTKKKYNAKFQQDKFGEIETVITKYFYKYYEEINNSKFVTLTTAEKKSISESEDYIAILEKINKYMDQIDGNSQEYLYCMALKAETLSNLGYTEESAKLYYECVKLNTDPYLNNNLRRIYVKELKRICQKLYSADNRYYIHRELEVKGLSREQANEKTKLNQKRLTDFYSEQINRVYPSVFDFIEILIKVKALDEKRAEKFVKKLKIKEDTKFNLNIVKKLHILIFGESIYLANEDDELENLDDRDMDKYAD